MSINRNDGKNIPAETDAYYEAVASQEEIYLEEVEEELRAILIFGEQRPSRGEVKTLSDGNNDSCVVESLQERLTHAAEELITDDSDDPPLSDEPVAEMLRVAQIAEGLRSDT